jgi:hypothetical protein
VRRYLYFPTYAADWTLEPTQYILCGSPRIVTINAISSAATFLWEQISPDPLLFPVIFIPNNTTRDVFISIPTNTPSPIELRITLNGDTNNYKFVSIYTDLTDFPVTPIKGASGNLSNLNTLELPLPYVLAPFPPDGPQVIEVLNNTFIGVQLNPLQYRFSLLQSVRITDTTNSSQQTITFTPKVFPYNTPDNRIKLKLNNNYTVKKTWPVKEVFSQEFLEEPYNITLSPTPQYIADEYIGQILKGTSGNNTFVIAPYTTQLQAYEEAFTSNILKGTSGNNSFVITPYTTQTQAYEEVITTNIIKGTSGNFTLTRIPYTSNVVGG